MAITDVTIANMALSNLGNNYFITALNEGTPEADQLNLWYDTALDATLSAYDWNFARKLATLSAHADTAPTTVWAYRYTYPTDCVKVKYLVNPLGKEADPVPYEFMMSDDDSEKTIVTDLADAEVVYTVRIVDEDLYTPYFIDALSLMLAAQVAIALTGKKTVKESLLLDWQRSLTLASTFDANEKMPQKPREAEHIRGRA